MKYIVNENCVGCGLCCDICSQVFEMTSQGVAKANGQDVSIDEAKEAMESCPVEAIEEV